MYLENKRIITAEGIELQLNCETAATRRCRTNYYFDCNKCANQSIGDDTGTQWDCNNYNEVEAYETTPRGCTKIYCANYKRTNILRRTRTMTELKPNKCRCKNPDSAIYGTFTIEGKVSYKCMCVNCGKETKEYPTEEQAISAWNKMR